MRDLTRDEMRKEAANLDAVVPQLLEAAGDADCAAKDPMVSQLTRDQAAAMGRQHRASAADFRARAASLRDGVDPEAI